MDAIACWRTEGAERTPASDTGAVALANTLDFASLSSLCDHLTACAQEAAGTNRHVVSAAAYLWRGAIQQSGHNINTKEVRRAREALKRVHDNMFTEDAKDPGRMLRAITRVSTDILSITAQGVHRPRTSSTQGDLYLLHKALFPGEDDRTAHKVYKDLPRDADSVSKRLVFRCPVCHRGAWTFAVGTLTADRTLFCGHDQCQLKGPVYPAAHARICARNYNQCVRRLHVPAEELCIDKKLQPVALLAAYTDNMCIAEAAPCDIPAWACTTRVLPYHAWAPNGAEDVSEYACATAPIYTQGLDCGHGTEAPVRRPGYQCDSGRMMDAVGDAEMSAITRVVSRNKEFTTALKSYVAGLTRRCPPHSAPAGSADPTAPTAQWRCIARGVGLVTEHAKFLDLVRLAVRTQWDVFLDAGATVDRLRNEGHTSADPWSETSTNTSEGTSEGTSDGTSDGDDAKGRPQRTRSESWEIDSADDAIQKVPNSTVRMMVPRRASMLSQWDTVMLMNGEVCDYAEQGLGYRAKMQPFRSLYGRYPTAVEWAEVERFRDTGEKYLRRFESRGRLDAEALHRDLRENHGCTHSATESLDLGAWCADTGGGAEWNPRADIETLRALAETTQAGELSLWRNATEQKVAVLEKTVAKKERAVERQTLLFGGGAGSNTSLETVRNRSAALDAARAELDTRRDELAAARASLNNPPSFEALVRRRAMRWLRSRRDIQEERASKSVDVLRIRHNLLATRAGMLLSGETSTATASEVEELAAAAANCHPDTVGIGVILATGAVMLTPEGSQLLRSAEAHLRAELLDKGADERKRCAAKMEALSLTEQYMLPNEVTGTLVARVAELAPGEDHLASVPEEWIHGTSLSNVLCWAAVRGACAVVCGTSDAKATVRGVTPVLYKWARTRAHSPTACTPMDVPSLAPVDFAHGVGGRAAVLQAAASPQIRLEDKVAIALEWHRTQSELVTQCKCVRSWYRPCITVGVRATGLGAIGAAVRDLHSAEARNTAEWALADFRPAAPPKIPEYDGWSSTSSDDGDAR